MQIGIAFIPEGLSQEIGLSEFIGSARCASQDAPAATLHHQVCDRSAPGPAKYDNPYGLATAPSAHGLGAKLPALHYWPVP